MTLKNMLKAKILYAWCGKHVVRGVDIDVDVYVNKKRYLHVWHVACSDLDAAYHEYRDAVMASHKALKDPVVNYKLHSAVLSRRRKIDGGNRDNFLLLALEVEDGKKMIARMTKTGKVVFETDIEPRLLRQWLQRFCNEVV